MIGKPGVDKRYNHGHLLGVVIPLAVKTNISTASADGLVHIDVRVDEITEMSNDNAIRFHAGVFENIQLFERRFAWNSGMRKNRDIRRNVRLADGAENLA